MRNCQAPKEETNWICPGCGNENYASRLYCNMRRCQQIKPGVTMLQLQSAGQGPMGSGKGDSGKGKMSPPMQSFVPMARHPVMHMDPKGMEPGAWTCLHC